MDNTPKKILVVEDHPDTLKMTAKLLRMRGYQVSAASTKAEALKLCEAEEFDLLLSDLDLTDGSGLDLMRELAEKCGIKGIAYTGYGFKDDIAESQAAGYSMHLLKPVDIETIFTAIETTLA